MLFFLMRVRLKRGKQTELLEHVKAKQGINWSELANILGVKPPSLYKWRKEKTLMPLEVYKKIDRERNFEKYIIELKINNWGQKKAGLNSKGTTKEIIIPPRSNFLAEFMGIMAGDGNSLSIRKGKKVGVHMIRIAGDIQKDKEYLEIFVKNLINNLFGLKSYLSKLKSTNAAHLVVHSSELVKFLSRTGFPPGNKLKNRIGIPQWITQDKHFLRRYIRGLIDTDGSVYRMSNKDPNLIRIDFTNYNPKLLRDCRKSLHILGYHPSKIINNRKIVISRQNEVARYCKEIGFSNSKHIKRLRELDTINRIAP